MPTVTRHIATLRATGIALAAAAGLNTSLAQCVVTKIMATDKQSGDAFGAAVAVSRDASGLAGPARMIVGAWGDDLPAGIDAGSAYTFYQSSGNWVQAAKIIPIDAKNSLAFGSAVALSDPGAIVAARGEGSTGAAYIFERTGGTWVQTAKIIPSGSQPNDDVGASVAITGTSYAAIGIPGRDVHLGGGSGGDSDPDAGVVALALKVNGVWTVTQTMPTRAAAEAGQHAGQRYGSAVAMGGSLLVCGAPNGELPGGPANHGFIDIYRSGSPTWNRTHRLAAQDAQADDHFGAAVATDVNYIAVGAPDDDIVSGQLQGYGPTSNCGSVTIYRWDGSEWFFDGQIFAQDLSANARFGSSVSISDGCLVVGAVNAKRAYIFKRIADGQWEQVAAPSDPDDAAAGSFARSVAVEAGQIVIGDRDDETFGFTNHGAAYALPTPPATAANDSCGGAGRINGHGTYSGCTTAATLRGGSTCGSGGAGYGPDVYFLWTPRCSGQATLDTSGSDFDTVLSVHSACSATAQNTIACNDDAPGGTMGLQSSLTFNYQADLNYLIRVSGYGGAAGNFTLRVFEPGTPANDSCAAALTVTDGLNHFDTCGATTGVLAGPTCAIGGANPVKDVWFRYTSQCTGTVIINTCGSNFDTVLQVFGDSCPALNTSALECSDDLGPFGCGGSAATPWSRVQFPTTAGQSYLIRVGGWDSPTDSSEFGHGWLTIGCQPCPCDWNTSGSLSVQDIFDFLAAYFAGSADFNQSSATTVQDIFDFLACYFAGCA